MNKNYDNEMYIVIEEGKKYKLNRWQSRPKKFGDVYKYRIGFNNLRDAILYSKLINGKSIIYIAEIEVLKNLESTKFNGVVVCKKFKLIHKVTDKYIKKYILSNKELIINDNEHLVKLESVRLGCFLEELSNDKNFIVSLSAISLRFGYDRYNNFKEHINHLISLIKEN